MVEFLLKKTSQIKLYHRGHKLSYDMMQVNNVLSSHLRPFRPESYQVLSEIILDIPVTAPDPHPGQSHLLLQYQMN